jgi:hypothetical protein
MGPDFSATLMFVRGAHRDIHDAGSAPGMHCQRARSNRALPMEIRVYEVYQVPLQR